MTEAETTVVEPESKKKTTKATEYHIFKLDGSGLWEGPKATVMGTTGKAAVAAYLKTAEEEGTYVPVPTRSWNPITVEVETQTKLKLT
jgi:hypothetical protein